jgi:ankyrin repeat protein
LHGWKHESVVRATLDLLATRGEKFSDPSSGYSLLHLAVSSGDIDVAAYLLEKHQKRDASLTFKHGNTFWHPPLFYAVRNGHAEIFIHLLHSGADPFQRFQTNYILGGTGIPLERVFSAGEKMENFDRGPHSWPTIHVSPRLRNVWVWSILRVETPKARSRNKFIRLELGVSLVSGDCSLRF